MKRKIQAGIISGFLILGFLALVVSMPTSAYAINDNAYSQGKYLGQTSLGSGNHLGTSNTPHGIQMYLTNKDDIGNIKNGLLHGKSFQVSNGNLATTSPQAVTSDSGFDGLNMAQSGGWIPPDVQVAAGTTQIVEMVNLEAGIYDKTTHTLSSSNSLSNFYSTGSDFISDPKIIFDDTTSKWFAAITDITTSKVLLAVSNTDNAAGTWKIFSFDFGSALNYCPDQPILGLNDDKVVISTNQFSNKCGINGGSSSYVGAQYVVIDKNSVTSSSPPSTIPTTSMGPNSGLFSVHPAHLEGTTGTGHPIYLASVGSGSTSTLKLITVTGNPSTSDTAVTTSNIPVNPVGIPPDAKQSGTTNLVATGDSRVQDAQWRNGKLWVTFNDACTPSGDTSTRSCLHLIQIDTSTNTKNQDIVYGMNGKYLFYPAIAIDGSNNLSLFYGFSSSSEYPSLNATGQASGQTSLQQPVSLKSGTTYEGTNRYGDYFGAGVDPSNTNKVWAAGEYHSSNPSSWNTWISSIVICPINQDNTATVVSLISSPLTVGQSTSVTSTVTDTDIGSNTPTGSIIWSDSNGGIFSNNSCGPSGNNLVCTATYVPSSVLATQVTASYSGDASHKTSSGGSNSITVNQASTTTSLVSSLNPSAYRQSVTFTATVSISGTGTPTGSVQFYDGSTLLGTSTLSSGKATYSTSSLSAGTTHSITSTYAGNSNFATSTSNIISQFVKYSTTSSIAAPSQVGKNSHTTIIATVTDTTIPSGTVTWSISVNNGGTLSSNTCTLSSGSCSVTYNAPTSVKNVTITISYGGDSTHGISTASKSIRVK